MSNPINPLDSVASIADSVATGLDELFTSDEERERAKLLMMTELNKPHIMQAMITMEEAKNPNLFVAGWRPALGWLTVFLLAYAWVIRDLLIIALNIFDPSFDIKQLPDVDAAEMLTLVFALLGLGATRTYEKVKGVSKEQWKETPKKRSTASALQNQSDAPAPQQNQKDADFTQKELTEAFDPMARFED